MIDEVTSALTILSAGICTITLTAAATDTHNASVASTSVAIRFPAPPPAAASPSCTPGVPRSDGDGRALSALLALDKKIIWSLWGACPTSLANRGDFALCDAESDLLPTEIGLILATADTFVFADAVRATMRVPDAACAGRAAASVNEPTRAAALGCGRVMVGPREQSGGCCWIYRPASRHHRTVIASHVRKGSL